MKKRVMAWLLAAAAVTIMAAGCGKQEDIEYSATTAAATTETAAEQTMPTDVFAFVKDGVIVTMNAPAEDLVDRLGQYSYFESESCAFDGLDKQYDYGSFVLSTYPIDGKDFVSLIEIKDDLVATAEGLAIGASESDITALYGEPNTSDGYSYTKGDSTLLILVTDGKVSSIQYKAITG